MLGITQLKCIASDGKPWEKEERSKGCLRIKNKENKDRNESPCLSLPSKLPPSALNEHLHTSTSRWVVSLRALIPLEGFSSRISLSHMTSSAKLLWQQEF